MRTNESRWMEKELTVIISTQRRTPAAVTKTPPENITINAAFLTGLMLDCHSMGIGIVNR
ncbi:hypothetical protein PG989_000485 [Apiospora arundinis]